MTYFRHLTDIWHLADDERHRAVDVDKTTTKQKLNNNFYIRINLVFTKYGLFIECLVMVNYR